MSEAPTYDRAVRARLLTPTAAQVPTLDQRLGNSTPLATRSEAQRDRDRVLYSSAFQRLGGVTQVSASEASHTFHSRLTHSLKVAQFSRRLAERLKARAGYSGAAGRAVAALDEDAAEAAALAHDIGHPPFGHLAEEELNFKAGSIGGFEGNAQSFRVLTKLALIDNQRRGLNLTRRTLRGVLKYPWGRDSEDAKREEKWNYYAGDEETFRWVRKTEQTYRSLEAEIMDWADDVTYAVHDMDDFYRAGLVPLDRLCQGGAELERFVAYLTGRTSAEHKTAAERIFNDTLNFDAPYDGGSEQRINLRTTGSALITRYLEAPAVVNRSSAAHFEIDDDVRHEVDVLKELMWFYVIERPSLATLQHGQRLVIRGLYEHYDEAAQKGRFGLFPALYAERLRPASPGAWSRIVVDMIANMTEAGAMDVYRRLEGISTGSVVDIPGGR